jgi:hypothetical protein
MQNRNLISNAMNLTAPDYQNPNIPRDLRRIELIVTPGNVETLAGYGQLVHENPEAFQLEIVRWPAQGWRPVDPECGDQGGTSEGIFTSYWKGDILYGSNEAVGGQYVLGYATEPADANPLQDRVPEQFLMWHANYHPDGGQLFYPLDKKPFVVPLALPGDDVRPEDFVAFWFDGTCGLYIHPNIWHEGVFTCRGTQRFFDKQGAVHARVSVCFPEEFGCLLSVDLNQPNLRG